MTSLRDSTLAKLAERGGRPASPDDLLGRGRRQRGGLSAIKKVLRELVREGVVERAGQRFRLAAEGADWEGIFRVANPGRPELGELVNDSGLRRRVRNRIGAVDGDRVVASQGREACELVQILRAPRDHWVGVLRGSGARWWLEASRDRETWRVAIAQRDCGGAAVGEIVTVVPVSERAARGRGGPTGRRGRVLERHGMPGEPEADFRALVWRHRLPLEFPAEVLREVERCRSSLSDDELGDRSDLRHLPFVTIDPVDARDFDDAVFAEPVAAGGTCLWVAIADVAHYVAAGSATDREALYRSNSVYLPGHVLPMLPERLSGDLCSLRPDVDRRAVVVEMEFSADARLVRRAFHRAVIRSRARCTYDEIAEMLSAPAPSDASLYERIQCLAELATRLGDRRRAAGAIDLDLPEVRVLLDSDRRPIDAVRVERNLAHRLVEEAMLAANRCVAEYFGATELPAIYRVHEPPTDEKRSALGERLATLGVLAPESAAQPSNRDLQAALRRVAGRPEAHLVHTLVLRSMSQARYSARNAGHFALSFDAYLHFTSPIRRYADLVVHRQLVAALLESGKRPRTTAKGQSRVERATRDLERTAQRLSFRERIAADAEREMLGIKKAVLMAPHVGERFRGTITGVAAHGIYVTLDAPCVEGLLHIAELPGRLDFDEDQLALVTRGSGKSYALGDEIDVELAAVDLVRGWINWISAKSSAGRADVKRRGRRSGPEARPQGAPNRGKGRRSRPAGRRGRP